MNQIMPITQISWANRQREKKIDLKKVQLLVEKALPWCSQNPRKQGILLPSFIEVTFLSNRAIAKVHDDFFNDPTPTDVITFRHSDTLGEILVGVATAAAHAKEYDQELHHELALCVIHGLLHLLGYDDMTEEERFIMHREQEAFLKKAIHENDLINRTS